MMILYYWRIIYPQMRLFPQAALLNVRIRMAKKQIKRAQELYEGLIAIKPENCSAINNLGVIFERNGNLEDALSCFDKAFRLSPDEELYRKNLSRIKEKIEDKNEQIRKEKLRVIETIVKDVNLDFFEHIGYTDELKSLFNSVNDDGMREILLRDLQECAISLATGQDKSATIMCGSIIEALLLNKIVDSGKNRV